MDDPHPYAQHRLKQATEYTFSSRLGFPLIKSRGGFLVVKSRQTLAITGLCLQSNDLNAPQSPHEKC